MNLFDDLFEEDFNFLPGDHKEINSESNKEKVQETGEDLKFFKITHAQNDHLTANKNAENKSKNKVEYYSSSQNAKQQNNIDHNQNNHAYQNLPLQANRNTNPNVPPPCLTPNIPNVKSVQNLRNIPNLQGQHTLQNVPICKNPSCSIFMDDDVMFKAALNNPNLRFNPMKLGFIPSAFWGNSDKTFGEMVKIFFQRKNNSKCRFPHKLYNALILSQLDSNMFRMVGAKWVDRKMILINRNAFARLLGIKAIEGSLFHQQGNFPSHGFEEVDPSIIKERFKNFDFSQNRIIIHTAGVFVYGCSEADISSCKWNCSKP